VAEQSQNRRSAILLVGLLFGQLMLMTGSARDVGGAGVLESWTMTWTSPIVRLADIVGGGLSHLLTGGQNLLEAHSRSAELEEELGRLHAELRLSREAAQENSRLRRLLAMRDDYQGNVISASVVVSNQTDQAKLVIVNRGTRDGVRTDLPVIAWGGAVGRVVAAYERHSKVRLLTDPNSGVAGLIQRSRAQGMVLGNGDRPLELHYVPRFSDVVLGDLVVTSALDGIFPRGYEIGKVISFSESRSGAQTIYVAPELDYGALEEVLILTESVGGDLQHALDPADRP
jgi:rod shape-determining protein MreC